MDRARSLFATVMFGLGMTFVYMGERLIGAGGWRFITAVGVVMVVASRFLRPAGGANDPDQRRAQRLLTALYLLGVIGLALYFLRSDLASFLFGGKPLERDWLRLDVMLDALSVVLVVASLISVALVERAYQSMVRAPKIELRRLQEALMTALGIVFTLVTAFSFCFVATERDKKLDLSYFRTARPGESTRKIVGALDQPLSVSLFFPPANEVREQVNDYFVDLSHESKLLEVKSYDHAVDPAKAKELGVSGNGIVVVSRGGRREQLNVGLDLEQARSQLRNLDKEVQKRLVQVARPGRTVYLTSGHGERGPTPPSDTDKRLTVRDLRELLLQQGYSVRDLGAAEGLAADVPQDAAIVAVVGATKPFAKEEAAAMVRYLDRGGRIFFALDPEAGLDMKDLLAPLGVKFSTVMLANDQAYWARTHTPSDHANIATGTYSSHPSVTTLGHLGMRAPMVLVGAGSVEEVPPAEKPKAALTVDFPVRSHPATWNDANGNFAFDPPAESRKSWNLSAAIVKKNGKPDNEGRALVLADSDAVGDGVINNLGNAYFVLDGIKWLLGDEAFTGEVSSEADVPIAHTHKQDVIWFYSTIFLAPALALGVGFLVMRRRQRAGRKEAA